MAAGHSIGTIYAELDLDASRYTRGQQKLLKDATSTTLNIEQNFKNLGVKSSAEMDLMRAKISNSYERIKNSAQATANDILRAEKAKNDQLTRLNEMQYGKQASFFAQLKNNWMAVSAAVGASVYVVKGMAEAIIDTGLAAQRMELSLKGATGSVGEASSAQAFLRTESERLGLVFEGQVRGYTMLAAAAKKTSLEGQAVRDIWLGIASAGGALQMTSEDLDGALRAISQVMSKGKVQAEELRGQLGERIPGAFQVAARAMNMTTAELSKALELGQVYSEDFLP
ncbi:MAG: tape measure protein, partial [Pseudomonadota bacterium]